MMKRRISSIKKELPSSVAAEVQAIADHFRIKSAEIYYRASYKLIVAEGYRYWGFRKEESGYWSHGRHLTAVSDHTIGSIGVTYRINDHIHIPEPSIVVEVSYYDKYYMTIVYVDSSKLEPHG